MADKQPDALELASIVESFGGATSYRAAATLRRQHALIAELVGALEDLFGADMEHVLMGYGKDDQIAAIAKAHAAIAKAKEQQ